MAFEPTDSGERQGIRSTQPIGVGPKPAARPEQTASFEAPANVRVSRLIKARVKVNSTRQGSPRPTGPWSPQVVAHAAERKPNESGEVVPGAPVWPRAASETMEYEAYAALAKETGPVEPIARAGGPKIMARRSLTASPVAQRLEDATRPVTSANLTVPLIGPPDALLRGALRRADPAVHDRARHDRGRHATPVRRPGHGSAAVEIGGHQQVEKVVAALLFLAMLGLLWLNLS